MSAIVLVFDTAAPTLGVGLWAGGVARERTVRLARGSERVLLPLAAELLTEARLGVGDLDAVGVAAGPGAFTGLRVGLATAAGLAQARKVPLVLCSSFAARGSAVHAGGRGVVMLDARKQRVYAQAWADGAPSGEGADVPPAEAIGWMNGAFWATGEGAEVYRSQVEAAGGVVVEQATEPRADRLAELAALAFTRGEGNDPAQVRPVYLREPDAVIRRTEGT